MIRWCAYCQKYLGESAPFEVFEITHGTCRGCIESKAILDDAKVERGRRVGNFYDKVRAKMRAETCPSALLAEGLDLGLDPWDLLVGIIQPALGAIGQKWACAASTIAEEQQLTATCSSILALMHAREPGFQVLRRHHDVEVLLVNAEGNAHALGLQLVEFFLLTRSVPVLAIHTGLTPADIVRIVQTVRPARVGISCALLAQVASARRTALALADLPLETRPEVFVGGLALREHGAAGTEEPFRVCLGAADLLAPAGDGAA